MRSPTLVFGVPIDDLTLAETVDRIAASVERGRATGRTHQVVTVNVDFLVNALADPDLLSLLQRADLAVADGMPVVWGSKLLGTPVRERVAGADLVPALAARCAAAGYRLLLFGGAEGVADTAADLLRQRYQGLDVIGDTTTVFTAPGDMDASVVDRIRAAAPDILCVALGHPKQEKWIAHYRAALGVPVLIGVGGSIDFLVGRQRRAPEWMQRTGTEWMHRMLQDPGRLARRYGRDLVRFGPTLVRELALFRTPTASGGLSSVVEQHGSTTVVRPRGRLQLDAATLGWTDEQWAAPTSSQRVVIDFGERPTLDHAEFCALVGFAKHLVDSGGELQLAAVHPTLALMLVKLRLYGFLPTASAPPIVTTEAATRATTPLPAELATTLPGQEAAGA